MNRKIIALSNKAIEIRKKEFLDFTKFRKYYFKNYNKIEDSVFHKDISFILNEVTANRGTKLAIAAPRGSAKSTLVTLQYILYCICYKIEPFIVIISNTSDQACGFLENIKQELEANDKLIKDFPEVCEIGKKPGPPRWTKKEIQTRNGIKVIALGAEQQIRGRRNKENRPSLIILDDIEADTASQNPENYYKLQDWFEKSVLKVGNSATNIIFIGTIHHYDSLLAKYTAPDQNFGWKKKIYRSVIKWSDEFSLWEKWKNIYCNREDFENETGIIAALNFFKLNEKEMLLETKVLWEQSKSYYDLMVQREEEGYISFDSEMQNEPVNPRDCIFNLNDVHYWDNKFRDEDELLIYIKNNNSNVKVFAACDPSLGKNNKRGDYSAILTIVYDKKKNVVYILDADLEKRTPDKTINDIIILHNKRKFSYLAFESNGFQTLMVDQINSRAIENNNPLKIEKIENKTDKKARIETMQPLIKNGLIQFSKKHRTILEQLKSYPKGAHDDGLDALQMVYELCISKSKIRDMESEVNSIMYILDKFKPRRFIN